MFQIELPLSLVHVELITPQQDYSCHHQIDEEELLPYYTVNAREYVVLWLQTNTPTYKLLNVVGGKTAYFQRIADLILFKLAFDIPGEY